MRAVLERDLVGQATRTRSLLARFAVGAAASVLFLFVLSQVPSGSLRSGADAIGAAAFALFRPMLLGAALLLTPALVVGTMIVERRAGNLAVLLTTPLSGVGLAGGKLLSRTTTVLVWIAAALPPLTVAVLFGGVSMARVSLLAATVVAVALETGAWALVVSTFARRLATATVLVYLVPVARWLLAYHLAAPALRGGGSLLLGSVIASPLPGAGWVDLAAALPGIYRADAVPAGSGLAALLLWPGAAYLLFAGASALLAVLLCGWKLSREEEWEGLFRRRARPGRSGGRWRQRILGGNPVAWKESLLLNAGGSRPLYYLAAALLLAAEGGILLLSSRGRVPVETQVTFVAAVGAALAVLAGLNGATSMVQERTGGTLEPLRISPLTPREIVVGKILGLVTGLGWLLVVPLFHLGFLAAMGLLRPWTAVAGAAALLLVVASYGIIGVRWGILASAPWAALAGAVLLPAVGWFGLKSLTCVGPFVLLVLGVSWGRLRDFAESIALPGFLTGNVFLSLYWSLILLEERQGTRVLARGWEVSHHGTFEGFLFLALHAACFGLLLLTVPGALALEMERLSEGKHLVPRHDSEWARRVGWRG